MPTPPCAWQWTYVARRVSLREHSPPTCAAKRAVPLPALGTRCGIVVYTDRADTMVQTSARSS
jgi:hypothetical protein